MADEQLPGWFSELTPAAQRQISEYLRTLRLQKTAIEERLLKQDETHTRIQDRLKSEIAALTGENARLQAALDLTDRRVPRPMKELLAELDDWYRFGEGQLMRLAALIGKWSPKTETSDEEDQPHA